MEKYRGIFTAVIFLSFGLFVSGVPLENSYQDVDDVISIPAGDDEKRVIVVEFVNGTSTTGVTRDNPAVIVNVADASRSTTDRAKAPAAVTEQPNSTAPSTVQSVSSSDLKTYSDLTTQSTTVTDTDESTPSDTTPASSETAESTTNSTAGGDESPSATPTPYSLTSNTTDGSEITESSGAPPIESIGAHNTSTLAGLLVNPCRILQDGIRSRSFDTIILPSQCVLFLPPATVVKSSGQTFSHSMRYTESDMDMPDNYTIIPTVEGVDIISRLGLRAVNSPQSGSPGVILTRSSFTGQVGFPALPLPRPVYPTANKRRSWPTAKPFGSAYRRASSGSNSWINRYPSRRRQQPDSVAVLMTIPSDHGRQLEVPTWGGLNGPEYFKRRRINEAFLDNLPSWFALVDDD
ncbi:hypothetical protein RvY_16573 [Ramazzottius varieornatus]|uniref:Uncharacterized protein n=1 Tax=Ramazzottius varieornatus TaxID=947166 RepID=A0A1D1W1M9_RAMVA|nr:hypothetical protein RvY_16573 [Ramazzottius varieornatus]